MSRFPLNCLLLNDAPTKVFTVKVLESENVSILKELIKAKNAHQLHHLAAKDLILWKLETPIALSCRTSPEIAEDVRAVRVHLPVEVDDRNDLVQPLGAVENVSDYWEDSPQPKHLHILVQKPAGVPPPRYAPAKGSPLHDLEELRSYFWGKDRVHRIGTVEIIDIHNISQFNPLSTKILLVRQEYRIAYDAIIADAISQGEGRSIILLTGQPGIGKTFFLLYFVFRQLQDRQIIALQLTAELFVMLDEHGVHPIPVNDAEYFAIPKGIWTLSDSYGPQQPEPCDAFQKSKAHLLHTSSPASDRWKYWVSQLNAVMYIMDVWSPEEFRTLLTVSNLPIDHGLTLFDRYGSNIRVCLKFLKRPNQEDAYICNIQVAASRFARNFTKSIQDLLDLDFSSKEVSSKIFALRPKSLDSRQIPSLGVPTTFLLKTLALALARDAMAQQHVIFAILNTHPTLRSPTGWMFEHMAHVFAADPGRSPLEISIGSMKGSIPAPQRMLSGNEAIRHIQSPFDFYWRPRENDFEGVDAVIRKGYNVWALQYTVSRAHRAATEGLTKVHEITNWKRGVRWHLVMVGSSSWEAESAQKSQKLTGSWAEIPVFACVMQFGVFNEQNLQQLSDLLDDVSKQ